MIKISVIVPVYNTEKYLERCLESIISQSLKEIEIIIINDGSTDKSLELIKKFEITDKRLKIINKKNEGPSIARNIGIENSKGEYIIQIDSDDWIEQDYLKDIYSYAKKDSLDIVITDFYLDYDDSFFNYTKDIKLEDNQILCNEKYLQKFLRGEGYPCVLNKLFRSDLYKKTNIKYPIGICLGEDLVTVAQLIEKAKKIGKINKAYLHYIQNPNSITKNGKLKKVNDLFFVLYEVKNRLKNSIEEKFLDGLIINNLGGIFYSENFMKDYCKEANKFLDIVKETSEIESESRKNKIFFKILKKNPTLYTLNFIRKINLILIKIKMLKIRYNYF